MNPILFIPSPRDIPEVKKNWHDIPYDKFIVKYTPQLEAYTIGKHFFLEHPEYTHLIMCPDDLEIKREHIQRLVDDADEYDLSVVSGICNIDETQPNTLAIQKVPCNFSLEGPPVQKGAWIEREDMPDEIFEVGHSGFCGEIISRDVFEKVSWVGATNGGKGNFDWQFSRDCNKLGVRIFCDPKVDIYHRRIQQTKQAKSITNNDNSYTIWLKDR